MDPDDADDPAEPRLPPPWYHASLGAVVALVLVLARGHLLLVPVGLALLLVPEVVRRRRGYAQFDRSITALHVPLPGWGLQLLALMTMMVAFFLLAGGVVPREAVPTWAAVGIAVGVGAVLAVLWRRSESRQLAAVRRIKAGGEK